MDHASCILDLDPFELSSFSFERLGFDSDLKTRNSINSDHTGQDPVIVIVKNMFPFKT